MPGLRVLAGTSLDSLVPITEYVNRDKPFKLSSDRFEGEVVASIKGFTNEQGQSSQSEYFERADRQGITWSIQVQGRFLKHYSADDILFGNTFDRPLHLPWGSGAALKFMNYIDPTLEHDLASSTKPWALSPLVATMPYFAHTHLSSRSLPHSESSSSVHSAVDERSEPTSPIDDPIPPFPPPLSLKDDTSQLHFAHVGYSSPSSSSSSPSSSSSSLSSSLSSSSATSHTSDNSKSSSSSKGHKHTLSKLKESTTKRLKTHKKREGDGQPLHLETASQRRSFFSVPENRQKIEFGPDDIITTDFCYGFLEFNPTLSLRLPGGITFDLMKYWDGQPVRFVCCERKHKRDGASGSEEGQDDPWGRVFWAVAIEPV